MMHTNFEEIITSGDGGAEKRGNGILATSVMFYCYSKNRDMKQTWQNINICLVLWVSTRASYYFIF